MNTLIKEWFIKSRVLINHMIQKRLEFGPYYTLTATEGGGGTPVKVPLAGLDLLC